MKYVYRKLLDKLGVLFLRLGSRLRGLAYEVKMQDWPQQQTPDTFRDFLMDRPLGTTKRLRAELDENARLKTAPPNDLVWEVKK